MPLITMVFTDVVGSSATKRDLSLGRDNGERDRNYLERIQTPYFQLVRSSCEAHGGREVSNSGDAFYLTFDDPVRAVRCCVDIQKSLGSNPIQTPLGPLRLRIGIHSGFPAAFEGSPHGTDVDTASRIENAAYERQILLSSRTYELVRHMTDVKFHCHGEFPLDGVGAVTLWELVWDGGVAPAKRAVPALPPARGGTLAHASAPPTVHRTSGSNVRTIVVAVLCLACAAAYHRIESAMPWLLNAEMSVNHALSWFDLRTVRAERVLVVEIDDAAFWSPPLSGTVPTNRRYLADLARATADGGALVIGIDFRLDSLSASPGDDNSRAADNLYFLQTIRALLGRNVPVVLTCWLGVNDRGEWKKEPLIFQDADLPQGLSIGHINMPVDPRQVPLPVLAWDWDESEQRNFDSFAMQIVKAYEALKKITPLTAESPVIKRAVKARQFVNAGFLNRDAFRTISAADLWNRRSNAAGCCAGQIVLIGGDWHEGGPGAGRLIDSFRSPAGELPGVFMHANYIESLLDGRYKLVVPWWIAVIVDSCLVIALYYLSSRAAGNRQALLLPGGFLLLLAAVYAFCANFGLYLAFMAPLLFCVVHIPLECFVQSRPKAVRTPSRHLL